jgi:HD domain
MSQESDAQSRTSRWRRRPILSRAVVAGRWIVPVSTAAGAVAIVAVVVGEPASTFPRIAWWTGLFFTAGVVLIASWRVAGRAMPLSVLLKMGIVFPGEAPSRLRVAAGAARASGAQQRLEEAGSIMAVSDPSVAAQRTVALAAATAAADGAVRGHAERVGELADLVGYELRLEEGDRDRLRWAALLHDIGKVVLHPGIVYKRGWLSWGERELLRGHPMEGKKLVAPLSDWLGSWESAITEHHERFDGEGYPLGLRADEISLGGRIVAVVDAYDTMTNVRANKSSLSPDAARAELARCAGAQFDPEVVRAFLAIPKRRLRRRPLPAALLGVIPVGTDGPDLAAVGRTAAAMVVAGSAFGLVGWKAWTSDQGGPATGSALQGLGTSRAQDPDSGQMLGGAPLILSPRTEGLSGTDRADEGRDPRPVKLRSGAGGSRVGRGAGAGSGPPRSSDPPPVTGAPPTSQPTTPPSTGRTSPPPTSKTPPPTTPPPTTTPPTKPPPTRTPPPAPATRLSAAASCTTVLIGPRITLRWTDSTSSGVRGYAVLRSSNGSSYAPVGFVQAQSSSYVDTGVQGLGVTYWYEVEARSSYGSTVSSAVSATTPLLCFSSGTAARGEPAGDVQESEGARKDGDRGEVAFGIYLDDVYGPDRLVGSGSEGSVE